jgi:DNA-binding transcriptional MerR regulator
MSEYRISQVALRTGFSPPTLRYYERIGLIPEPDRTPSGYRVFTQPHLDLLGFIARAKRLGLSLKEIRILAEAKSSGDCRTTQEQLLSLVETKLTQVRQVIRDLIQFGDQLERVHAQLSHNSAPRQCGPDCGCEIEVGRVDLDKSRELALMSTQASGAR